MVEDEGNDVTKDFGKVRKFGEKVSSQRIDFFLGE
jgi:hypothetical protein